MLRGGEILRDSLRNIAERVRIPAGGGTPVVVFNPLNWSRDDVVRTHVTLFGDPAPADIAAYRKGMRLLDETGADIPFELEEYSENISRALQIVFIAKGVPSLGYRTYTLVSADRTAASPETSGGDVALKRVRKRCVDEGGGETRQGGTLRCHGVGGSHLVWLMSSPRLDLSVSWIWVLLGQWWM